MLTPRPLSGRETAPTGEPWASYRAVISASSNRSARRRPLARGDGLVGDAPAHPLHEDLADGEAEPRPALLPGVGGVGLGELLEEARDERLGDAGAAVLDGDADVLAGRRAVRGDADTLARRGEPDGVARSGWPRTCARRSASASTTAPGAPSSRSSRTPSAAA